MMRLAVLRFGPSAVGLTSVVGLALAVDVHALGRAIALFPVSLVPPIVVLSIAACGLQGLQWHPLLRALDTRIRARDTMLLNAAGQATAMLPMGELSRAILVADVADANLGRVVATITAQELLYTLALILLAIPGIIEFPKAAPAILLTLAGILALIAVLSIGPLLRVGLRLLSHTPGLRRMETQVAGLQMGTVELLGRPSTYAGASLGAVRALMAITVLWLVLHGLAGGAVGWREAALVFALSNILGAASMVPGGIGASEASMVGLLVLVGLDPGTAAAAALLHRLADKGLATTLGVIAFSIARHRYTFRGLGALLTPARRPGAAPPAGSPVGLAFVRTPARLPR